MLFVSLTARGTSSFYMRALNYAIRKTMMKAATPGIELFAQGIGDPRHSPHRVAHRRWQTFCTVCRVSFETGERSTKYCSQKCRNKKRRAGLRMSTHRDTSLESSMTRHCLSCDMPLSGGSPQRQYCGGTCRGRVWRQRTNLATRSVMSCFWCNKVLIDRRLNQKYCNPRCRLSVHRHRHGNNDISDIQTTGQKDTP